jgi:hypothetical protein
MEEIIQDLELSPHIKQVYQHMANLFQQNMPDALYLNYYKLEELTGIHFAQWEDFLDIPEIDRYINSKIQKLIEFDAKAALKSLAQDKTLSSQEITALKEVLTKSKLMKANQQQQQQVILMRY